jgi:hypothetical protein
MPLSSAALGRIPTPTSGENADGSLVLQLVQKPPYAERMGTWQR